MKKRTSLVAAVFFFSNLMLQASPVRAAEFDRVPDATINTRSLFDLPKDIVALPVLRDLLTEDFVFYYQQGGADWSGFKGAIIRLAYENKLDWPTKMLGWILNGPAEIALWKSEDGKLSHFMVVVDQTAIKDLASLIAKAAAADSQLKTKDGSTVLTLPSGKAVYLAADEGRFFVYSDPAMKVPSKGAERGWSEKMKAFFGANADVAVFGPKLGENKHVLGLSMRFLSFGYQEFFRAWKGLRFDFSQKAGWSSQLEVDGSPADPDGTNWSLMPRGAALCASLPFEKKRIATLLKNESLLKNMKDSAIACWYAESKFYTPVIVVPGSFKDESARASEWKALFSDWIGSRGAVWVKSGDSKSEESDGGDSGGKKEASPPSLKFLAVPPVQVVKTGPEGFGFMREVGGRYGVYPSSKSASAKQLGSKRFFRAKFMVTPGAMVFSPDDRLVDKVLTTLSGKFPSMAASMTNSAASLAAKSGANPAAVPAFAFSPAEASKIAKAAILEALPESQESIFRSAVSRHLLPNLDRFSKHPLLSAGISGKGESRSLEWVEHADR
ncbi:MAG: DUF2138 family protein [Proteobacteria bacterium]|nr:DUF2138 family protein [Pseudomonadota bacterium]